MTKEQEVALIYELIDKHYGSGVLMAFADLVESEKEMIITYSTYQEAKIPKRMKVEYVKVEDSIFDLQHDLVDGKLFYQDTDDSHYPINTERQLVYWFDLDGVYRKVETEIDERQEFIDTAIELIDASKKSDGLLGAMFDSGKFKLAE